MSGSCQYVMLYGVDLLTALCEVPCDGEYCQKHKKLMAMADELDGELQQIIREDREKKQ